MSLQTDAKKYVDKRVKGTAVFFHITAKEFIASLKKRIDNPGQINQKKANVCGPAAFLYGLALKTPMRYAKFACDLYLLGSGDLGTMVITAPTDVKNAQSTERLGMDPVDWITLASLRRSRNWIWKDLSSFKGGMTWPLSLKKWFEWAGLTDVVNDTSLLAPQTWTSWGNACDELDKHNAIVCLLVNGKVLLTTKLDASPWTGNHWICLAQVVTARNPVDVWVFTWGGYLQVKFDKAKEEDFRKHFFGYVSARP